MDLWHVAAALFSAMLHAGWNAAVKASPKPAEAMTAQMVASALLSIPGLIWSGLPAAAAWPWIAASTIINMVAVTALLRAYERAGFGITYPVVRALSVLMVVPLAAGLTGEMLSPFGFAGVGLMVAALVMLALGSSAHGALPRAALLWIVATGACTAVYTLCDAQGVRHAGSPFAYGFVTAITNAIAMTWLRGAIARPWRLIADQATTAVPAATAAMTSYLLILWVWSGAPIAPAAALRDTSAIFALLIAIFWLKEPFTPFRLAAIVLAAAAVPLLRFA
jgi:drug/metabolite transporter (DMT)-like permease